MTVDHLSRKKPVNAAPDPRHWKALALLCVAFFIVILDGPLEQAGSGADGLRLSGWMRRSLRFVHTAVITRSSCA
jgi:hypothetical protein